MSIYTEDLRAKSIDLLLKPWQRDFYEKHLATMERLNAQTAENEKLRRMHREAENMLRLLKKFAEFSQRDALPLVEELSAIISRIDGEGHDLSQRNCQII